MSGHIYNQSHVIISRILGRSYNNPLGQSAFPLLKRILSERKTPELLDAGCGRGQSSVWWARHSGAQVDAFDPSAAMLDEAAQRAAEAGLSESINLHQSDITSYKSDKRYDLILVHDVLCYSPSRLADLERLTLLLKPDGVISVSDYYLDGDNPEIQGVLSAWGIIKPFSFAAHAESFSRLGLQELFLFDTTRQYREHWLGMKNILTERRHEVESAAGIEETASFAAQIDAILSAVSCGAYGHCWSILELCK